MADLTAYLDESGTHGDSKFTVMSGYIGRAETWEIFDKKWDALCLLNGISHIHAVDLVSGKKLFKDKTRWPLPRRNQLAQTAVKLAEDHSLYSLSVILTNADYDAYYLGADQSLRKHRTAIDSKYGVCFRIFLSLLARLTQKFEDAESSVRIVMEAGHRNANNAQEILRAMFEVVPDLAKFVEPVISYALKIKSPGCQAADLLAYPAYVMTRDDRGGYDPVDVGIPDELPREIYTNFRIPIPKDTLTEIRTGQIALTEFKRVLGPHWQELDRMPIGWMVSQLRSSEAFVLMPLDHEDDEESLQRLVPTYYVRPTCL